jgi:hypothetical protein
MAGDNDDQANEDEPTSEPEEGGLVRAPSPPPPASPPKTFSDIAWEADDEHTANIYDLGLRQVSGAEAASGRLDQKATGLFGVVGFCMTLAISFGGWALLENARKVPLGRAISILFIIVLFVGLITAGFALRVLRVRNVKSLNPDDVFNESVLQLTDKHAYRSYLAAAMWYLAEDLHQINVDKAKSLWRGQVAFAIFMLGIFSLSGLTVASALQRGPETPPSPTFVVITHGPGGAPIATVTTDAYPGPSNDGQEAATAGPAPSISDQDGASSAEAVP